MTLRLITVVLREPKFKSIGRSSAQPMSTEKDSTSSSDEKPTITVTTTMIKMDILMDIKGSSCASSPSPSSSCIASRWVTNWKKTYAMYDIIIATAQFLDTERVTSFMSSLCSFSEKKTVTKLKDKQERRSKDMFTIA